MRYIVFDYWCIECNPERLPAVIGKSDDRDLALAHADKVWRDNGCTSEWYTFVYDSETAQVI